MLSFLEFIKATQQSFKDSAIDQDSLKSNFDVNLLDFSLYGVDWESLTEVEFPEAKASFYKYKSFFENKLKQLIQANAPLSDQLVYYFALYKINAYEEILPKKPLTAVSREDFKNRPSANEQNFKECFGGAKTLHAVVVMDGWGDLVHFCNWFEEYGHYRDVSDTKVIISYSSHHHKRADVLEYLQSLPAAHALRDHKNMIVCDNKDFRREITSALFMPAVTGAQKDRLRAAYFISTLQPNFKFQQVLELCDIGLQTCVITEMGAYEEQKYKKFHLLSFGVGYLTIYQNDYAHGFFFPTQEQVLPLDQLLPKLSDNLLGKLLGDSPSKFSKTDLINKISNLQIVCGYYQKERTIQPIFDVMNTTRSKDEQLLFLTGTDEVPEEIIKYAKLQRCTARIVAAKLNEKDYADLLQLLRTDTKHHYFCSGDNTFATSLAIGKIPIYLQFDSSSNQKKSTAIYLLSKFIESLAARNISDVTAKNLRDVAKAIMFPKAISMPASKFFAEHLGPYICREFNFSANMESLLDLEKNYKDEPIKMQITSFADPEGSKKPPFIITHWPKP